ncbi:MAG: histidine phosphatase family protein [Microbacterium sp.]
MANHSITEDHVLRLWLVRHGRTLFNELSLAQGWCDSPLTAQGRAAVGELAENLRAIDWAAVYSSPSERAMDTAEIIVGDRYPILRDRRWKEYNFGVWEGRPNMEVMTQLAGLAGPGDADIVTRLRGLFRGDYPALEGGETGAEYAARVAAAIQDLRRRHTSGDVLVVTHGMTLGVAATQVDEQFDFGQGVENATFGLIEYAPDGTGMIRGMGLRSPAEIPLAVP